MHSRVKFSRKKKKKRNLMPVKLLHCAVSRIGSLKGSMTHLQNVVGGGGAWKEMRSLWLEMIDDDVTQTIKY